MTRPADRLDALIAIYGSEQYGEFHAVHEALRLLRDVADAADDPTIYQLYPDLDFAMGKLRAWRTGK